MSNFNFYFLFAGLIPPTVDEILWRSSNASRLYFEMNLQHPDNHHEELAVSSAKLRLYKENYIRNASSQRNDIVVNIYQIIKMHENRTSLCKLICSKVVSFLTEGWEEFDIADALRHWVEYPSENFGLEITMDGHNVSKVFKISQGSISVDTDKYPALHVQTKVKPILNRIKREEEKINCVKGDGESRCCRYPLWISFREIGWDDWVVAPEGYQAYYCEGSCPNRYKLANTFSSIKSILHMFNPNNVPAPCCTASKLSKLNLLHFDESGELTVSEFEDMIVDECKCA